jgi:hypothetical protein
MSQLRPIHPLQMVLLSALTELWSTWQDLASLIKAALPPFWAEAIRTANKVRNRRPTKARRTEQISSRGLVREETKYRSNLDASRSTAFQRKLSLKEQRSTLVPLNVAFSATSERRLQMIIFCRVGSQSRKMWFPMGRRVSSFHRLRNHLQFHHNFPNPLRRRNPRRPTC